jgi:hypothetical protein
MIVLNESIFDSNLGKLDFVIALEEEAAFIFEYGRLDQTKPGSAVSILIIAVI